MPHSADESVRVLGKPEHAARYAAAGLLVLCGCAFILLAGPWRAVEGTLASHAIHLITGQTTIAVPATHSLILYQSKSVYAIFVLTNECSVAYLLAAIFIIGAPLMLLRQLSPWRTLSAIAVTAAVLIVVNVARLTAIGATVSGWGRDPGLQIAHTYLGSVLTMLGACGAGVALAVVLVGRRKTQPPAVG